MLNVEIDQLESIIRRIEPDLGAEYIGSDGTKYIDAADFFFELPDRSRTKINIDSYNWMALRGEEGKLEALIRVKMKEALNGSLS